ncbi:LysE type translocator [Nitrosomonas cryotolerans]|uniref:LysE type translocator n=1 Tax=Nitrosomonas cryotolerans ATCC 49181 TaxID=1131553 RepID=A0A1N6F8A2_9PROT|nr:LysE family transporter [Nitrosomonas cryotolerans]SFP99525.1 LysE type translocator [Nitrosomonas cryotolerans]SIN91528.1 LysE type translocator [Nitrosomonas cryotolerans ATCC 49181]
MTFLQILLFIPAYFVLNLSPGPNNLMALANGKYYGVRTACYAGAGRFLAFAGMITLAALGLASILYTSEHLFFFITLAVSLSIDFHGKVTGKAVTGASASEKILTCAMPSLSIVPRYISPWSTHEESL